MRAGVGFLAVVLLSITAAAALMKEQFVVEIRTDVLAEEFRSELTDYNLERMLAGDQEVSKPPFLVMRSVTMLWLALVPPV